MYKSPHPPVSIQPFLSCKSLLYPPSSVFILHALHALPPLILPTHLRDTRTHKRLEHPLLPNLQWLSLAVVLFEQHAVAAWIGTNRTGPLDNVGKVNTRFPFGVGLVFAIAEESCTETVFDAAVVVDHSVSTVVAFGDWNVGA